MKETENKLFKIFKYAHSIVYIIHIGYNVENTGVYVRGRRIIDRVVILSRIEEDVMTVKVYKYK